jgi:hypothetical protein
MHVKLLHKYFADKAPPVGAYDPKDEGKVSGGVIEKSDRFKAPKGKHEYFHVTKC